MAAGDGLVSMTPTSIAHSGTSASINADGGVDFTAVTSLSLNGVFTSDYDNYVLVMESTIDPSNNIIYVRLRASGSDASDSGYTSQSLDASNTTVSGSRATSQTQAQVTSFYVSQPNGLTIHWYGPALSQPTAWRSVSISGLNGARVFDFAVTHSLSTSYDGFTIYSEGAGMTGNIHVFGYEE